MVRRERRKECEYTRYFLSICCILTTTGWYTGGTHSFFETIKAYSEKVSQLVHGGLGIYVRVSVSSELIFLLLILLALVKTVTLRNSPHWSGQWRETKLESVPTLNVEQNILDRSLKPLFQRMGTMTGDNEGRRSAVYRLVGVSLLGRVPGGVQLGIQCHCILLAVGTWSSCIILLDFLFLI